MAWNEEGVNCCTSVDKASVKVRLKFIVRGTSALPFATLTGPSGLLTWQAVRRAFHPVYLSVQVTLTMPMEQLEERALETRNEERLKSLNPQADFEDIETV